MKRGLRLPGRIWFVSLVVSAAAAIVCFKRVDVPLAYAVNGSLKASESLATGFASVVLLGLEAAVVLTLVILRITSGHLSPFRKTTALACLASICAYAINDTTLKFIFGVPTPGSVFHGARHALHLMSGNSGSSFPSGHMALAGAFAAVFMRFYRVSIVPLAVLLGIGAALLITGTWHFASDVIAGTFVGISAGLLASEVWQVHSAQ